ncbi:MAG TPA: ABC transporter permease [Streptosporangiaceae bacterium]|jgi:ABC-2 type transport system permease protein
MTEVAGRMPGTMRLLVAQIGYQARLLAGGRAVIIGVGLPVILLIASHGQGTHTSAAVNATDIAGFGAFGLTLTGYNTYGVRLVAAREAGVLKRWRATPLPRWCYFLGRILATVVVAAAAGAATVAAGVLLYGTHVTLGAALTMLAVFVLGGFAWAAIATALSAAIPTVEAAAPTLLLTYFPVIIISGVFGAVSEPHWLATIASYLPAQPLVHAVAGALQHTAAHPSFPARDLAVLAVWAVAGLAVAIAIFRWEPHRPAQRRPARTAHQARPDTAPPTSTAHPSATQTSTAQPGDLRAMTKSTS